MAIEEITEEQQKASEQALEVCKESAEQDEQQMSEQIQKAAKEELDKQMQQLAKIPETLIESIQTAISQLLSIVNGYNFPGSTDFDPDKLISSIESLLQPVIDALTSLPIPSIPGLEQMKQLLTALSQIQITGDEKKKIGEEFSETPEISSKLMSLLNALLAALQSIAITLPLALINLIFDMLGNIIDMFDEVRKSIGVPDIPSPLSIVPDCLKLMPKIFQLIPKFGIQVYNAVEGKIRQMLALVTMQQFPEFPDSLSMPKSLSSCPKREEKEIADEAEQQEEQNE